MCPWQTDTCYACGYARICVYSPHRDVWILGVTFASALDAFFSRRVHVLQGVCSARIQRRQLRRGAVLDGNGPGREWAKDEGTIHCFVRAECMRYMLFHG